MPEIENTIYAQNVKEWREWLRKNHKKENKIFLILYKKHTGKPSLRHREALKEAICFGWIDTTIRRLDEDRYGHHFVKRTKKSRWSNNTLRYAQEMIKKRKMSKFGLEMYQEGLKKPVIDHSLPRNPKTPLDLQKALGTNKEKFENLAPSYKRFYIYWIENAKKEETRKRRINIAVKRTREGKKLGLQ